jgi:hypothetical protein
MNYLIIHAIHHGRALIFKGPLKGKRNFLFSMYLCWVVLSFPKKEPTGRRKISESQQKGWVPISKKLQEEI